MVPITLPYPSEIRQAVLFSREKLNELQRGFVRGFVKRMKNVSEASKAEGPLGNPVPAMRDRFEDTFNSLIKMAVDLVQHEKPEGYEAIEGLAKDAMKAVEQFLIEVETLRVPKYEFPAVFGTFSQVDTSNPAGYMEMISYICRHTAQAHRNGKYLALYKEICELVTANFKNFFELSNYFIGCLSKNGFVETNGELNGILLEAATFLEKLNAYLIEELMVWDSKYGKLRTINSSENTPRLPSQEFEWKGETTLLWSSHVHSFTKLLLWTLNNAEEFCLSMILILTSENGKEVYERVNNWKLTVSENLGLQSSGFKALYETYMKRMLEDAEKREKRLMKMKKAHSPTGRLLTETETLKFSLARVIFMLQKMEFFATNDETSDLLSDGQFNDFVNEHGHNFHTAQLRLDRFQCMLTSLNVQNISNCPTPGNSRSAVSEASDDTVELETQSLPANILPTGDVEFILVPKPRVVNDNDNDSDVGDEFFEAVGGTREGDVELEMNQTEVTSRGSYKVVLDELEGQLTTRKEIMRDRERAAYRKRHGEDPPATDDEVEVEQGSSADEQPGPSNGRASSSMMNQNVSNGDSDENAPEIQDHPLAGGINQSFRQELQQAFKKIGASSSKSEGFEVVYKCDSDEE